MGVSNKGSCPCPKKGGPQILFLYNNLFQFLQQQFLGRGAAPAAPFFDFFNSSLAVLGGGVLAFAKNNRKYVVSSGRLAPY